VTSEAVTQLKGLLPLTQISDEVYDVIRRKEDWRARIELARQGVVMPDKGWGAHWMPGITPYEHQLRGYAVASTALEMSPGTGLWHDMGLGKTLTSLALLFNRHSEIGGGAMNALVICPSSVIGVWGKAIDEHVDYPIRYIPLTGPMPKRALKIHTAKLDRYEGITLFGTNYESLWREALETALCSIDIEMVIADEAQAIKTAGSKQSKAARKIASKSKKIASTGTPTDKQQDYFGIFRWLDPSVFGTSETAFIGHWFDSIILPGVPKPKVTGLKPHLEDEFMEKIHSVCHSAKKEDCLDLPKKIDTPVPVELEPAAMKKYIALRDEALAWLDSGEAITGQNILTRMGRCIQLTGGFVKDELGKTHVVSTAKADACVDLAHTVLDQEDKLVIYCRHTAEIDELRKRLSIKYTVDVIDGRVPAGQRRDDIIDRFQEADLQIVIIQERAGGAGITLHASSTAIDYSRSPDLIPYLQKRDRVHRIGMPDKPVTYFNLYVPGTLDDKILHHVLQEKRKSHEITVHQWKGLMQ
jgi:non-specific serine/threonine protein kinase